MVCLIEETAGTLYLLGEQDRIVGISGYVVRPPQARREKPRVSAFALKPDLVLTFSDLQQISLPISFAGGSTSMPLISEPAHPSSRSVLAGII